MRLSATLELGRALKAAAFLAVGCVSVASGQITGYGVTANGSLFKFDPAAPATAITIGNMGIVPEGIDFRPGTSTLYAIDVGATTSQLYTVNTATAAVTPVGAGFPSQVAGSYNLTGNNQFGFDFNPRTLQADGSVRIRMVANNAQANLRLNSDTGVVASVDVPLQYAAGDPNANASAFVDAIAYTNSSQSTAAAAGTTTLYGLDVPRIDRLVTINPPNNGTLNTVGPFGVTVDGNPGMSMDIVSTNPADDTLADELAFAVFTRTVTSGGIGGSYLLYDVNLSTGATTNGRLVGGGLDFTGGLAMLIPEPSSLSLLALGAVGTLRRRRA